MRRFVLFALALFVSTSAFAVNTDFLQLLWRRWFDADGIMQAQFVSRGQVAELLNMIDCQNCHRPSRTRVQTLSSTRRAGFQGFPGKNFDDVSYSSTLSSDNAYYCISYVGNQWYMNGYPRATSPLCSGKFCAWLPITVADTIQTIFNIAGQSFYSQYRADRTAIDARYTQQKAPIQKQFGLQDFANIQQGKKNCGGGARATNSIATNSIATENETATSSTSCNITSLSALQTYAKYCTYEPAACGISELPFAKKGQRPIAEINMLVQQGIFTASELAGINVENYAKGDFVLEIFGRVKARAQCLDSDDQDADWISDSVDTCYLTYNPQQSDNDKDGIWNACDDDVDNDRILNPIGVLDDRNNIVYDVIPPYLSSKGPDGKPRILDNCILTANTDQKDSDSNKVGDACDVDEKVGLKIQTKSLTKERFVFVAVYSGSLTGFTWTFGDATTGGPNEVISHTYNKPDTYTVRVDGYTPKGTVVSAYTTATVWLSSTESQNIRANLLPDSLVQQVGQRAVYHIAPFGFSASDVNYISIVRGDWRTRLVAASQMSSFVDQYPAQWGYAIQGTVYLLDGRVLPVGAYVTVVGGSFCLGSNPSTRAGQCDMDNDALPDMCDSDIDGDGAQNPLWLITYMKPDCTYGPDNTQTIPQPWNNSGAVWWWVVPPVRDGCPFVYHTNQSLCGWWENGGGPTDSSWTGTNNDIDGDGIPNAVDACPLLAETINGVKDSDGCPEIDVTVNFPPTQISAGSCVACPCQYAKDDAGVSAGDRVKAVLFDTQTNQAVTESQWYTVP
jgi:PKD domain/Thrombospondin type 3 repeat